MKNIYDPIIQISEDEIESGLDDAFKDGFVIGVVFAALLSVLLVLWAR